MDRKTPRSSVRQMQPVSLPIAPMILIKEEIPLPDRYIEPLWARELVREWSKREELLAVGAYPTQSVLLRGPSGVGKTTSARWISQQLGMALFSMSMARTIDSYMGKTGSNIEAALQYGINSPVLILVDEIDAIAAWRAAHRRHRSHRHATAVPDDGGAGAGNSLQAYWKAKEK